MAYALEQICLYDRGERVRAEAVLPQVVGEGRSVGRINAFYRAAGETWLARVRAMRLPAGRYAASLCGRAVLEGEALTVELRWRLCRRGRAVDEGQLSHRWDVRRGWMLSQSRKKGVNLP